MEYWNKRFLQEGKIWGQIPSKTAVIALKLFQDNDINKVLVPGAGYGRNSKLFSNNGFNVVGIEISQKAFEIAKDYDSNTRFINDNVLNLPINDEKFDAIYCFNVLHLFLKDDRALFLQKCMDQLNNEGYVFFVVFSDKEKSFGKGKMIEPNTFESKLGRPVHYFTKEDLIDQFKDFHLIQTGIIEDEEDHGEIGKHVHVLRYISAKKRINL